MAVSANTEGRGQWGSSLGFIMAAAGSAVGLGNIWRFPYLTGQNGGGAFVFVYIICVLFIGIPLLFNEIALGRRSGKNPIGAIRDTGGNKFWQLAGVLCVLVCFFVFSYYSVIAGWTVGYIFTEIINLPVDFEVFVQTPMYVIPLTFLFILLTILIVLGGVSGGIEKAAKFLMPVLFIIIIFIAGRSVTLEGAEAGIQYYLNPDFSKINGTVILQALGQAFFSMSVGWGLMITFGSYLPKESNIIQSSGWIAGMDTMVALLGGLMVFPALFALLPGKDPAAGPALVFDVLPKVFDAMPGGNIIGSLFFLLLMVAALTSTISMLEVPVAYLIDDRKWNRKKATWIVGIAAMIMSVPSALSSIEGNFFNTINFNFLSNPIQGFFGAMDFIFGTFAVVIICLMLSLYTGWGQKIADYADELASGAPGFKGIYRKGWIFFIKWVCPVVIILLILNMIGLFGAPQAA
ncbi:MAG TPA: sodium-dependent transporter [Algoriphagus sp.]|jgi:NSS family neurotransmitter:Na+ symporter|uniref:Transporter n=3 Tax=Algoriphagus TaxID=246875 RepID=A0A1I5A8L5_9BACT|nr:MULTISPECIES: sodium-dependent transporter [Algoriphagus]MAL12408.1 sodium-dependent transporter [Algoriphagus sp.]QYH39742.1 sodium-dependent transporter [Algoriphagus sp. NBT04N3]SFN58773.1 neurotransmitter:Na+ symporter, NSS family [Algoriphagus ornithinivorans]HAD53219.1 sodium-dependent transporter [Algoriphagus sp.]HAS58809.1 sodium-dependent transporter [Algoriphagus sp.]|tara:strand:+ start:4722 stop:6107 length:1386 start_codon:yes stop_codon:yes gene_type:complete